MSLNLDEVINWKTFKNSCNGMRAEKEGCIMANTQSIGKHVGIISETLSYKMCFSPTILGPTFYSLPMLINSCVSQHIKHFFLLETRWSFREHKGLHPWTVANNTVSLRYLSSSKPKKINFMKVASKYTLTHRHSSVMYGLFHIIQSNNLNLHVNKLCITYFTKNNFFLFIKSSSNSRYSWGINT